MLAAGLCFALAMPGCSRGEPDDRRPQREQTPASSSPTIDWAAGARCDDPVVNHFVEQAVRRSAAGDYEQYRLLWGYEQQPTSRKRFEQLRQAIDRIEVRTVQQVRIRQPDGTVLGAETPMYLFHAFIRMKSEAKQQSEHRLDDRDVILLIVRAADGDGWRFQRTPEVVKEAYLAAMPANRPRRPDDG